MKKMTNEELLKPRFKVIDDYPLSWFDVGEIVENDFDSFDLKDFPNIFQKMEWWEERNLEDLPKYLKDDFYIIKVEKYYEKFGKLKFDYFEYEGQTLYNDRVDNLFSPSTEEEYLEYIKTFYK